MKRMAPYGGLMAESVSFAMNAADTVKIDITGIYRGTRIQKCAFDQIILIPQY